MIGKLIYLCIYGLIALFRGVFWNWRIVGLENLPPRQGGLLFACNHLDWTDVYIVGGAIPVRYRPTWFAKKEVFKNPFVAWFLRAMNVIPLDRGEADRSAYIAAKTALERGAAMVVFPEGHRSPTGGLIKGKNGAVRLAVRTKVPIIPMAIWGTESGFRGAMRRKPIRLIFGEPYQPSQMVDAREQWETLTDDLMLRIAALLPENYRGIYRDRAVNISSPAQ